MRKIKVLFIVFTFSLLILPHAMSAASETQKEITFTGILHLGSIPSLPLPNETGYWLSLDEPVYVLQGSKSEASTDILVLSVSTELSEKARKLKDKRVVLVGDMNCTGNWASGAYCNMLVKQINLREK